MAGLSTGSGAAGMGRIQMRSRRRLCCVVRVSRPSTHSLAIVLYPAQDVVARELSQLRCLGRSIVSASNPARSGRLGSLVHRLRLVEMVCSAASMMPQSSKRFVRQAVKIWVALSALRIPSRSSGTTRSMILFRSRRAMRRKAASRVAPALLDASSSASSAKKMLMRALMVACALSGLAPPHGPSRAPPAYSPTGRLRSVPHF